MASERELSDFLIQVEKRALKQIIYKVYDEATALDIIQDSMIKIAEKYGDRPAAELPLLFQRILQNTLRDHFRRQKVRNTWVSLFSSFSFGREENNEILEILGHSENMQDNCSGENKLERMQIAQLIDDAIQKLPERQREAFLMRYWEEMDVAETATAMKCSQGSVKTHTSRALHKLASLLKAKGVSI